MTRIDRLEESIARLERIIEEQQRQITELRMMITSDVSADASLEENKIQPDEAVYTNVIETKEYERVKRAYKALYSGEKKRANDTDMEKRIGGMMGIVASIMVFIGIILFVTMVYSSFSEPLKAVCIFALSFTVLGIGIYAMNRKTNVFTMSLTGCGMGAVYLSLFITHLYFGYINQFILYFLIIVWALGVYYLFGREYTAFKLIGQIGITISVIFGFAVLIWEDFNSVTWGRLIFLMVFFTLTSWFYLLADKKSSGKSVMACILLDETAVFFFYLLSYSMSEGVIEDFRIWAVSYLVIICVNLLFFLWKYVSFGENKGGITNGVWYISLVLYSGVIIYGVISGCLRGTSGAVVFAVSVVILICMLIIELSRHNKDKIHLVSTAIIYILLLRFTYFLGNSDINSIIWSIYGLLLVIAGYRFCDRAAVYLSYFTLVVSLMLMPYNWLAYAAASICAVLAGLSGYKLFTCSGLYNVRIKMVYYAVIQTALYIFTYRILRLIGISYDISRAWAYVFCALLSIAACQKPSSFSFDEKREFEPGFFNEALAVNGILMVSGGSLLYWEYNNVMRFVLIAVTAAVYFVNIKPSYEKYGDIRGIGVYNGLKLTVYVFCVLKSFEFTGPVISIGWLLLAIIIISAGFKLEFKYLRVYGLGLTMFSVCKLLIFDINYDNAGIRAASFLLSGALCFVINLIYNNADKKGEK